MIQRLEVVGLNYQFDYGLKFNPDLNIFTGSNGCGKTTLLKLMWYLISGNLHRIITEIPFEFVLIETDQFSFSMASSNDHKNRGDTLHLVWKFGTGEEKSAQIRRSRFLRNQTVLSLNARIASVSQNSLFFPTFRRIEGGYSHFSRFVERLLVLCHIINDGYIGRGNPAPTNTSTYHFNVDRLLDAVNDMIQCWGNSCVEAPIDGLSVRFLSVGALSASDSQKHDSWRFNLRESNTDPLLRLNVETIGDEDLLLEKTTKISRKLESSGGRRETKFRREFEKSA